MELLTNEIDTPFLTPTPTTKKLYDDLKVFQKRIDPLIDQFYKGKGVSKSTLFLKLTKKFEYIFKKVYG